MKQRLLLKFNKNKLCIQALQETSTTSLVDAAPYDKLWGAGLSLTDPDLKNKQDGKQRTGWVKPLKSLFGACWIVNGTKKV